MKKLHLTYILKQPLFLMMAAVLFLSACGQKKDSDSGDDDKAVNAQVPVTVTSVSDSDMVD